MKNAAKRDAAFVVSADCWPNAAKRLWFAQTMEQAVWLASATRHRAAGKG